MDISIVELILYIFAEMFAFTVLFVNILQNRPATRANTITTMMFIAPGMIMAFFMMSVGMNVQIMSVENTSFQINGTTGAPLLNETSHVIQYIPLQVPIWPWFHFMIGMLLLLYTFIQGVRLFSMRE